ncbi:MAG: hypothetical protein ACE5D6_04625 [Candidatus Zixiibacteriota bacterium]
MEVKYHMIKGEVKWANIIHPKDNFNGEPEYSIKVKTDIEPLYKLGLHEKTKPDEEGFIKFKRPVRSKNGNIIPPPKVFNNLLEPWDFDEGIGNGSKCAVKLALFPYENFGGGVAFRIEAVQVLEHVKYEQLDPTEGFEKTEEELPF